MTVAPNVVARAAWSDRELRIVAAVVALVSVGLAVLPVQTNSDSESYLLALIFRSPVVPDVLYLCGARSGSALGLHLFVLVQALFGFGSAAWLARESTRLMRVPRLWILTFALLAFMQLRWARIVATESIAYAVLCVFLVYALRVLIGPSSHRDVIGMCASLGILVETRAQFGWLVPIVAVAVLLYVARVDRTLRARARTIAACAAVVVGVLVLQFGYTYPRTGSLRGVPFAGIQLATPLLHLATPRDIALVRDEDAREMADRVYRELDERRLLHSVDNGLPPERKFEVAYNTTINALMLEFARSHLHRSLGDDPRRNLTVTEWYALDVLTRRVAFSLLRSEWKRYGALVATEVFSSRYFAILNVGLLGIALWALLRSRGRSRLARLATALGGFWLCNGLAVSLVEPLQTHYSFYFDGTTLAFVGTMLAYVLMAASDAQPASDSPDTEIPASATDSVHGRGRP